MSAYAMNTGNTKTKSNANPLPAKANALVTGRSIPGSAQKAISKRNPAPMAETTITSPPRPLTIINPTIAPTAAIPINPSNTIKYRRFHLATFAS
jgi:hypothetical protein